MPETPNETEQDRSAFQDGGNGAAADAAPDGARPLEEHRRIDQPHAREADHELDPDEKFDQLADKAATAEDRQEALLDEAVEETFPGSDPISPKHIT